MKNLTKSESDALRYYIGDVSGDNAFGCNEKAYVTINSLFFPGILSESARAGEGKLLDPGIIADIPRLIGFFEGLFSAFGKARLRKDMVTFRVERMSDYLLCRQNGASISMTSTSSAGFLDSYRDRRGIALMRFELAEGGHFIDAAEMLGYYAKPEEAEILLPPFMKLSFREIPLTEKELLISDCDGSAPEISVKAAVEGIIETVRASAPIAPCPEGMRIYDALNEKKQPLAEDVRIYSQWKISLRRRLYDIFCSYVEI